MAEQVRQPVFQTDALAIVVPKLGPFHGQNMLSHSIDNPSKEIILSLVVGIERALGNIRSLKNLRNGNAVIEDGLDSSILAGLLYLGAGLGMTALSCFEKLVGSDPQRNLSRKNHPYLLAMVLLEMALLDIAALVKSSGWQSVS